jgi:hypothetical protein
LTACAVLRSALPLAALMKRCLPLASVSPWSVFKRRWDPFLES